MTAQDLIGIFMDTQSVFSKSPVLEQKTLRTQAASQLYPEGYSSPLRQIKGPSGQMLLQPQPFNAQLYPITYFYLGRYLRDHPVRWKLSRRYSSAPWDFPHC